MQFLPTQGVSVVIAVYNEIDNIAPLIAEIYQALTQVKCFEIIAVNDGSQDGCQQRLAQLSQQYANLRVINHSRNLGQSIAIINGVRAARYPWVATLDGDGQNDPADFLKLFTTISGINQPNRPVLAAGIRMIRHDTWLRRQSSQIANQIRKRLLKDDCPDSGCGMKVFQRDVFLQLPHFNHLHRFLPALYRRVHGLVINVPVNHRPRIRGYSKYGMLNRLWVGIVDLFGVMWLIRRPCPLGEASDQLRENCDVPPS